MIAIGADHAGFELKEQIKAYLKAKEITFEDFGTYSAESTDYPDYAHPLAQAVEDGTHELGVLICGSANGVCMTANKHQGVRAAIAWNEELAGLARQHNNANVLCLPSRFVSEDDAMAILKSFIDADFEGGRHGRRVDKIKLG